MRVFSVFKNFKLGSHCSFLDGDILYLFDSQVILQIVFGLNNAGFKHYCQELEQVVTKVYFCS